MNRELGPLLFAIGVSTLVAGCAKPPQEHYHWGQYEALILGMYTEPGSADPLTQIEKLTADIQQAEADGKPTPPGIYAHLGMMYAENGDIARAEEAFLEERNRFPEAAVFIDGMMHRALNGDRKSDAVAE